jgi:hypothetical protein
VKKERDEYKALVLRPLIGNNRPAESTPQQPVRAGRMSFEEASRRVTEFEKKRMQDAEDVSDIEREINKSAGDERPEGSGRAI